VTQIITTILTNSVTTKAAAKFRAFVQQTDLRSVHG